MTKNEKILFSTVTLLKKEITELKQTEFYSFASKKLKHNITRIETTSDNFITCLQRGKEIYTVNIKENKINLVKKEKNGVYLGSDIAKTTEKKILQVQDIISLDKNIKEHNISKVDFPEYFKKFLIRFSQTGSFIIKACSNIKTLSEKEMHNLNLLICNIEKFNNFAEKEIL